MNKKGMTLVELLVTFSLLLMIVVGIYNLILSVREDYEEKDITKSLTEYSASVSSEIQYDLLKLKIENEDDIKTEQDGENYIITVKGVNKSTGKAVTLTIKLIKNNEDGEMGIEYNGVFEPIPNSKFVELERGDDNRPTAGIENGCLIINFPIYSIKNDDAENYGFKIVYPFMKVSEEDIKGLSKYTVTLSVKNGSSDDRSITVSDGEMASTGITASNGYSSTSYDISCSNKQNATIVGKTFKIEKLTSDTSCTVEFNPFTYTVKYNANGGSGSMEDSKFSYDSSNTLSPNTFTRASYTFGGWALTSDGSIRYNDASAVYYTPTSDGEVYNLYAIWHRSTYKVKLNVINGKTTESEKDVKVNDTTIFQVSPDTGYGRGIASCTNNVVAYLNGNSLITGDITNDASCTLTYEPNVYQVKYNANDGLGNMENSSFEYNETGSLRKNTFTREGHTFAGWALTSDGEVKYKDGESIKNLSSTNEDVVELYAIWSINKYKVNVNVVNGTVDSNIKEVEYNKSTAFKVMPNEGYGLPSVSCTNETTATISDNTLVTGNITKDTTCTVTYNLNTYQVKYDANGGTGDMDDSTFTYNVSSNLSKNTFTKTGYTFIGWALTSDGEVKYKDEEEVKNLSTSGPVTLYAVWERNKVSYEVRYNSNGGEILDKLDLAIIEGTNEWKYNDGIYFSDNHSDYSSRSIRSSSFTLNTDGIVTFDIDVSSGYGDYLYYTIYDSNGNTINNTGKGTKIDGFSDSDTFDNLEFVNVIEKLSSGTYVLEFTYYKNDVISQGLDSGFVKNIYITSNTQMMSNTSHSSGISKALSPNLYSLQNKTFKGWSTTSGGEVKYSDKEEVVDLTWEANDIVDLYAVWEDNKYDVNVVVQNGTINGSSLGVVTHNKSYDFKLIPNEEKVLGAVKCTNYQKGIFDPDTNIFTINNVTSNTTCTITLRESGTTLYEDGTLIINEMASDRNSNISKYGKVLEDYVPFGPENSYVFDLSYHTISGGEILVSNAPWSSYEGNDTIKKVLIGSSINPVDTSNWFYRCVNMESGDFTNLNTSNTVSMSNMFAYSGINSESYSLTGLSNFNISNVKDMSYMFYESGSSASSYKVDNLTNLNVSSNPDMSYMFYNAGKSSSSWTVGDLSKWNTSDWTSLKGLFAGINLNNGIFDVGDLSKWNTSKVTDMSYLLEGSNIYAITKIINFINTWGTKNVTNMSNMFKETGKDNTEFIIDLSGFDTTSLKDMSYMFYGIGLSAKTLTVTGLNNWNTKNVTNMEGAFKYSGWNARKWNMGDISSWDTSSVTNMKSTFEQTAWLGASSWKIGDLSNWDTSNVTNMNSCFKDTATSVTTFNVGNLSKWNTSKVLDMGNMFRKAGEYATNWNAGDLSNWDTSNVTDMSYMFYYVARNANTISIGSLDNWNVKNVKNTSYMFNYMAPLVKEWSIGDLSNWNTSSITNMSHMFQESGYSATTWKIGSLDKWDTSSVTDMSYMFDSSAVLSTNFTSIGNIKIPSSCDVDYFASNSLKFIGNIIIQGSVRNYRTMFGDSSDNYSVTDSNSKVNLYYTNDSGKSVISSIISSKRTNQNIFNLGMYEG